MNARNAWIVLLCLTLAAPAAQAQSTLDKYLQKSTQSDAGGPTGGDVAITKVHSGPHGFWRADDVRAAGGSCSVTFVSGSSFAGYVGPTSRSKDAFILFSGPAIPPIESGKNRKMTLTTGSDGAAQTVDAFHAPNSAQPGSGIIFFKLTGIDAALADLSDAEDVTIAMDQKQVFSIKWQGGHKARAAMQGCLTGAPAPAAPTASIAENQSQGRSTITGTAYAKVALIAPRQYAPKGWDVGLIHMTPEMKQWYADAQAKAARGEIVEMPEHLKALFRSTKIEDKKGNFSFTNLPLGDYILRVSFNYKLDRMTSVDTGYSRCTVQGNTGQCNDISVGIVKTFNEGADLVKEVTINTDGETVKMDLSKRYVIRQGTIGNE